MILLPVLMFYISLIQSGSTTPAIIRDYIATEAIISNVNPQLAISIATAESKLNPNAIGDHGTSMGLWQIHLPAHASVSPENARSVVYSTEWAVNQLKEGNCQIWSTCPIRDD